MPYFIIQRSLIDRGANGGIAGDDMRIVKHGLCAVNVQGIDNHTMNAKPIATCGALINTQRGPIIGIFHQHAYAGKGKSIHSSGQLEHFKQNVDDRAIKNGGEQRIVTNDGHVAPLNMRDGLTCVNMRPYTDDEESKYPKVVVTSNNEWNPEALDQEIDDEDEEWHDAQEDMPLPHKLFDIEGNYIHEVLMHTMEIL